MLHVMAAVLATDHTSHRFFAICLDYLLERYRHRDFTAVDLAQTAYVLGRWRGGPATSAAAAVIGEVRSNWARVTP